MNESGQPETQVEAIRFFADSQNCHDYMVKMRWPTGRLQCTHCGSDQIGKLVVSNRQTKDRILKSGKVVKGVTLTRFLWNCKACKKQFTVKSRTIFEDSPLPLEKWLPAVWMIVNAKNGISSCELARALGVTQKSAWFMGHRIREALREGSFEMMSGGIEADESYIGPKARSMNAAQRQKRPKGTGMVAMTAVQGLLQRDVRKNHSRVKLAILKGTKRKEVQAGVRQYVLKGSSVYTDALASYVGLSDEFTHKVVDHAVCYAKGAVHTNGLENFWCLLKRMVKGTYVCPRAFHLARYLDEEAFRFNERKDDDSERFTTAMSGVKNRRLTWKRLTDADKKSKLSASLDAPTPGSALSRLKEWTSLRHPCGYRPPCRCDTQLVFWAFDLDLSESFHIILTDARITID